MGDTKRGKPGFETWNPLTGCTKISPGCKHCFAERIALRLQSIGAPKYAAGFQLAFHDETLEKPLHQRAPRLIFVNSMADLFHADVPLEFIERVFETMRRAHWHQFMIFTKRAERLADLAPLLSWPDNVWMGASVENADYRRRISLLRATPAAVKFLSCEPLLGPIPDMDLRGIDAIFCGGETGRDCRPCRPEWVRGLRDQCIAANVPFAFHGWGGENKEEQARRGRLLDGERWSQKPAAYERFMARQHPQLGLFDAATAVA